MPSIISVEHLSKRYILGHQREQRYTALRDVIADNARQLVRRGLRPAHRASADAQSTREEFWALRDVSFDVQPGDRIGIIGRNGAGKSTLLKLLSRITEPTSGRIRIRGRVASLLEVGTGFHPELTGRENIMLNGAILGMKRVEIARKFDEIVAFAEVEKFLDTPVKRYSSGMYMRLAFAVAAHLEPEILVVDEVLAVGDAAFQQKCLGKMGEVAREGRTVLFVSHNMAAIRTLCTRGILLWQGTIICEDQVDICTRMYESEHQGGATNSWDNPSLDKDGLLVINHVSVEVMGRQPQHTLKVRIKLKTKARHKPAFIALDITDSSGTSIMQPLPTFDGFIQPENTHHEVQILVDLPPLIPTQYWITVWTGSHNSETLDEVKGCVSFDITDSPSLNRTFPHTMNHGYIVPISRLEHVKSW